MLATPHQKWNEETWSFNTKRPPWLAVGMPARLIVDLETKAAALVSPDFHPISTVAQRFDTPSPSLTQIDFAPDGQSSLIKRIG
jgi:hypothetical protein